MLQLTRIQGALAMEAQSIQESIARIMFVTSSDNKIVDEVQVPADVNRIFYCEFEDFCNELRVM